jgi:rRNA maturation protein Nop10
MAEKCPTCGRALRKAKPKTPEEEYEAAMRKAKANINRSLRKPMPKQTLYKETAA